MNAVWIEELPNGKYKYSERYKDPLTSKWRKTSITLEKNSPQARKQAQAILTEKIQSLSSATSDYSDMTYSQLKEEYLAQWLPKVKDNTKRNNLIFDKHLSVFLPDDTKITNITKRTVRQLITKLSEKHNYPVVYKCRKRLAAILSYAVDMEYLTTNPTKNVLVPKPVKEYSDETIEFLNKSEILALFKQMEDAEDFQTLAICRFMFATGVRYGELAALTVDKINWTDQTITINATFDFNTGKRTTTKTETSTRIISVSQNILEIVKQEITENARAGIETDYIFVGRNGNPVFNSEINRRLKKYNPNITTHIFRHSHISYLSEKMVPIKAVMDRVGHSDPQTTLKIYSHTTHDMIDYINKSTAELF